MKKCNVYSVFILLTSCFVFGQKPSLKKADELFAQKSYVEAAAMYEDLKQDKHTLQNLGDCYFFNSEMASAAKAYGNLFFSHKDSIPSEYYFRYMHALKATEDYDKADALMSKHMKYTIDTKKFKEHLNNIVPYNYEIKPVTRSTSTGDFGLSFYGEKVVFASLRNQKNPTYAWNQKPYLDLFEGTVSKEGVLENVVPFSDKINTKTHESSAVFTYDGLVMYFSRTNEKRVEVNGEMVAHVKLYRADFIENEWTNVTELPFSSDSFSTMHPALSADETKLYFSSDRPGSLGSFDIYEVTINEDGTYTEPVNLGNTINTIHREQFPFVGQDGTLYFASDGHQGLGGLDIFMSKSYNEVFAKPINLGETINSGMDDFSFVVKEDVNIGYLASNRKGTDNLYAFVRTENERKFTVEGEVRDKNSKALLPGTIVSLYDENDQLIGQLVVGENADYTFNSEPNKRYRIEAERDFYASKTDYIETLDDGRVRFTIELEIESYDDAEEIIITKDDGLVYIQLENIYFDLNKWDIKTQAASTLDVLVDIMKKYPRMEVELGAHTDSRASDAYNLRLSQNRATATLEYLVANGISRSRMRSKGYGERVPLIPCGDNCNEEQHAINRRVEFIILK
ncbi:OmpA family protein [Flavobacterium orientale]|uniref:OmpA family protein n=1 Tax=Flavobacterium orientale TaxID=1756020 RepID=UPI00166E3262|nr:OmpA family protein [Flavobacterium orientale]